MPEDKLIDLMTAFEALFLKGVRQEVSYRLALRCAYFLGRDKEERKEIFDTLRDAYETRSKVIHGETLKSEESKCLPELVARVEEYLRRSIKLFLDHLQSKPHDEIMEEIDEKIVAGV